MAAAPKLPVLWAVLLILGFPPVLPTYNRRGWTGRGRWSNPGMMGSRPPPPHFYGWIQGPCEKMDMSLHWNIPAWVIRPTKMITCECGEGTGSQLKLLVKDMFKCKTYRQWKMYCEPCIDVDEAAMCQVYRHCLTCDSLNGQCLECPATSYGKLCTSECACRNGGTCDVAGECTCPSGFQGSKCEIATARECSKLLVPEHGSMDLPTGRLVAGAVVQISCQEGYIMTGSSSRTCQKDGSWSGTQTTCDRACSDPGPLLNGQVRIVEGPHRNNMFAVGTKVEFSCDDSWIRIGATTATCEKNGVWNSAAPACVKVPTCLEPENLPNGIIEIFQREGSSASGKVFRSAIISKSEVIQNSEPRFPRPLSSSGPVSPLAGVPLPKGQYHVGTQALFSCESKYYKLQGSRVRTCMASGEWSGRPSTCIPECGRSSGPRMPFITHGIPSRIGQWPWVVGISRLMEDGSWFLLCGASLIDERWLITAAHCLTFQLQTTLVPRDELRFYFGKYYRNDSMDDDEVLIRRAESVHVHPDYDPFSMDSDVALVRLSQPVRFSSRIQPVCLPPPESTASERRLREGNQGMIIGWGQTENGTWASALRHTSVPVVPNAKCEDEYFEFGMKIVITQNMFCAGYSTGVHDSCSGDSGGPLVFPGDSSFTWWVLEGITSWGSPNGCGLEKQYGGYVRVHKFVEWIHHFV